MDRIGLWTGVPCSYLAREWEEHAPVVAAQEGDAVAMACGAWLGGSLGGVLMQSSGLGNAVSPLSSLCAPFAIPVLLVISVRCDEPQHELMGAIVEPLLDLLSVARDPDDCATALNARRPYARLVRDGVKGTNPGAFPRRAVPPTSCPETAPAATRRSVLAAMREACSDDLLIATTGYTGRELYALGDRPNQLAMVGSMGCALSLGLGLARVRPERRVVVLDGDGALLMRLGSMATCGHLCLPNLVHVLLDNGCHDSTGGQPTPPADFCALAAACGYPEVVRVAEPEALASWLSSRPPGLGFAHVPIVPGTGPLPRPAIHPRDVATRFREAALR